MKKRLSYRLHAGTASILLVFLTLCLISFAVLTRVNANADLRLSTKYADRTKSYYDAVGEAERFIAETDAVLLTLHEESANEEEYFEKVRAHFGDLTMRASYEIGAFQSLNVTLRADYAARFLVEDYQVVTDESAFSYDEEPLNLPR